MESRYFKIQVWYQVNFTSDKSHWWHDPPTWQNEKDIPVCRVLLQTLHIGLTQRSPNQGQTSTLDNSQGHDTLTTWCKELTHWKRAWCWARLKAGGEGDDRGWDGWMASSTRWTWVWERSGSWWWTGRPGVLQSMGSQSQTRLSDWTELNALTLVS